MRQLSSRSLLLPLALLTFFLSSICPADEVEWSDVWTVTDDLARGGCSAKQRLEIEKWHDESGDLVAYALGKLKAYSEEEFVRKGVAAFFGIKPPTAGKELVGSGKNSLLALISSFEQVQDLLEDNIRGEDNNPPRLERKPALFCDGAWLQPVAEGVEGIAQDINGEPIWFDGSPTLIREAFGKDIKPNQIVFWSDDLKGYDFGGPGDGPAYCLTYKTTKGVTVDLKQQVIPRTGSLVGVTLCPLAFENSDSIPKLPIDKDSCIDSDGAAFSNGLSLSKTLPKSATLLHESFHVMLGNEFLHGDDEKYSVSECMSRAFPTRKKILNPETFVFFAMAMWYDQFGFDFTRGKLD